MTAVRSFRSQARARFSRPGRPRGMLIAFEGPDGSGKTTQRKLFKTWLQSEGHDVVSTKWNSSELIKPLVKSRKALHVLSPEGTPQASLRTAARNCLRASVS